MSIMAPKQRDSPQKRLFNISRNAENYKDINQKRVSRTAAHHSPCVCNVPLSCRGEGITTEWGVFTPHGNIPSSCRRNKVGGCTSSCDYVCEYTNLLMHNRPDSLSCGSYGFIMNVLEGLHNHKSGYDSADFHDVNVTASLLALFGYNDNGYFLAFPLHKEDQGFLEKLNSFLSLFLAHPEILRDCAGTINNQDSVNKVVRKSRNINIQKCRDARTLLCDSNNKLWNRAKYLFCQILDHITLYLSTNTATMEVPQINLYNMAMDEWNRHENVSPAVWMINNPL